MANDASPTPLLAVPEIVLSNDFDNHKTFERWAYRVMEALPSPTRSKCQLYIPHKHLTDLSPSQSLDNWCAIERWALELIKGTCGGVVFNDGCRLYIPYKTVLGDLQAGRLTLAEAQTREFDDWKEVELWGNRLARGEC